MAEWPDWSGRTAVIVATGPSASSVPLIEAKGQARVIVIKKSWQLAPWADVLYGCDRTWWFDHCGVPDFAGLKVSASPSVAKRFRDVRMIQLVKGARILTELVGKVGCGSRYGGGHSGFHAINLAVQFGAQRIVMVGFDMSGHQNRLAWCEELDGCADQFTALGIRVINASPCSALKNFEKLGLMDAIVD